MAALGCGCKEFDMSTQETSNSISSRQRVVLIGVVVAGLIAISVLVILWPRDSCEGIFRQTAPRLEVNLEVIQQKGAFAVSHEQIQELAESSQKVGLHLKACCTVLEHGKLDPDQYQQCIDKASAYEGHIALVAQQVTEAAKAREKGATEVLEENIKGIYQTIQVATRNSEEFAAQVAAIKPAKPVPTGRILATADAQTTSGVRVDIQELKRNNGTTTLKFVMINESDSTFGSGCAFRETAYENCGRISGVYLFDVAEKKKYSVVRDANGKCVCGEIDELPSKSRVTLWAKFPAVPENVRKIGVVIPHFVPMDDVPIGRYHDE